MEPLPRWKIKALRIFGVFFILLLLAVIDPDWLGNRTLLWVALAIWTPIVLVVAVTWWVEEWLIKNEIEADCPVCQHSVPGLAGITVQCPGCGELLKANNGIYDRVAPPGTVDVEAIEVSATESITPDILSLEDDR